MVLICNLKKRWMNLNEIIILRHRRFLVGDIWD